MDLPLPFFEQIDLVQLCEEAKSHFEKQDTLVHVTGPVVVVGDIHGSFHDLIRIYRRMEGFNNKKYLFLGDYVDRGEFSLEVIVLLFALAIKHPNECILLRGNHEFAHVNSNYGFRRQLVSLYETDELWEAFNTTFNYMPLACLLNGSIFCVHGGISHNLTSIAQVYRIHKPISDFDDKMVYNMMWADPTLIYQGFIESKRGRSQDFGQVALEKFLSSNNLKLLIRGHEYIKAGLNFMFGGRLITVFSASNYGGTGNIPGILYIEENNEITSHTFELMSINKREDAHFVKVPSYKEVVESSLLSFHPLQAARHASIDRSLAKSKTGMYKWTTSSGSFNPSKMKQNTNFPVCVNAIKVLNHQRLGMVANSRRSSAQFYISPNV